MNFDVVVVGSGAGGMVAALRSHDLGLKPVVIEKADRYGGTSAVSGAGIWIPLNSDLPSDTEEEALAYLRACTKGATSDEKLLRYIRTAPKVVDYLTSLGIGYRGGIGASYPDYYPEYPGAVASGRTMLVAPMEDGTALGDEFFNLRESYPEVKLLDDITIDLWEAAAFLSRAKGWRRLLGKHLSRYFLDRGWRRRTYRDRRLAIGNALVGGLRKAMLDRGIPLLLNTRMTDLAIENGRVGGVTVRQAGRETRIGARRGVVIASGGFEQSQSLRERHLDQWTDHRWSATPRDGNEGDAVSILERHGAALDFMNEAWWCPTVLMPSKRSPNMLRSQTLFVERGYPHCLMVNRNGVRFTNEIRSYHQVGQAMLEDNAQSGANLPCWFIFDSTYRHKYPLAGILPGRIVPDRKLAPDLFDTVLYRADSIPALAAKIGLDAGTLSATLERFNGFARRGVDEDFHKGEDFYADLFGDPEHKPNKVLGPVERAPFYAVPVNLGDLGTKGGARTDASARVLKDDGSVIPGLYAVGNVAGSVMAGSYPGAGATLGAAMSFAYLAVADLNNPSTEVRPAPAEVAA